MKEWMRCRPATKRKNDICAKLGGYSHLPIVSPSPGACMAMPCRHRPPKIRLPLLPDFHVPALPKILEYPAISDAWILRLDDFPSFAMSRGTRYLLVVGRLANQQEIVETKMVPCACDWAPSVHIVRHVPTLVSVCAPVFLDLILLLP